MFNPGTEPSAKSIKLCTCLSCKFFELTTDIDMGVSIKFVSLLVAVTTISSSEGCAWVDKEMALIQSAIKNLLSLFIYIIL
jgi:hypothetical protein